MIRRAFRLAAQVLRSARSGWIAARHAHIRHTRKGAACELIGHDPVDERWAARCGTEVLASGHIVWCSCCQKRLAVFVNTGSGAPSRGSE